MRCKFFFPSFASGLSELIILLALQSFKVNMQMLGGITVLTGVVRVSSCSLSVSVFPVFIYSL